MKLSEHKGKKYQAVAVVNDGVPTVEDIPAMRERLAAQIAQHPGAIMTETDKLFLLPSGRFVMKPVLIKRREGVIEFRKSGDYIFHHEGREFYGPKLKAAWMDGDTLTTEYITYTIGERAE